MPLTFELDPPVTPALRDGILRLWADVSNAGGAVGFVPPVTVDEVRPELVKHLVAMVEGRMRLVVGCEEDGTVAATAFVAYNTHRLMKHWVWLYTVMVHPSHQGKGYGRELMAAAEREVRGFGGIDAIRLSCRGGTGVDRFYASCGYKEVGRVPGAIRVTEGGADGNGRDDRDDILMLLPLD